MKSWVVALGHKSFVSFSHIFSVLWKASKNVWAMLVHTKNNIYIKNKRGDSFVAVVPKTMKLGCQARLMECSSGSRC